MQFPPLFGRVFVVSIAIGVLSPPANAERRNTAIYAPRTEYPLDARSRHLEGTGVFVLHLRADGSVSSVETVISTGYAELDQSGIEAFSKWRFKPGPKKIEVPLRFTMQGASVSGNSVGNLFLEARAAFAKRNYGETIRLTGRALKLSPDSAPIHALRGDAYWRNGDADDAIKEHSEAIRLQPSLANSYLIRGSAYLAKGEAEKSLADYDEVIRLQPDLARAYCDRADLEDDLFKQPEKALADYTHAIELDPKFERAYFDRGSLFFGRRDYAHAIADLTEAIRLSPKDLDPYAERALAYLRTGDRSRASADAQIATRLAPTTEMVQTRVLDLELRATAHEILEQWQLAERDLRDACHVDPASPDAYNGLAWCLATCPDDRIRNGREAVVLATKACELSGWRRAGIIDTLAAAYAESGDFDQAVKYEQQALQDSRLQARQRQGLEDHLRSFQQHRPYRQDLATD